MFFIHVLKHWFNILKCDKKNKTRKKLFNEFDNNIRFDKRTINALNADRFKYDYYIVGSDQVWNPDFGRIKRYRFIEIYRK